MIGNRLYVFGGDTSTVEVATIGTDHVLGPFSTIAAVSIFDAGGAVPIHNGVIAGPPSRRMSITRP